ncbi:hypothetical protein MZO42_19370 [Sphingomonas psychrotolerans]|uniref:Uncharacterized protein n=1 Tax=Sphingomonas psychrotolerans TaxID=1327635 RepID=A0ABU3N962_9SPHN|nr:hypothetical protein [Sphingomonas psychrotolerans]MDT8760866.1 hypothetical protein [Sphingomonas psychrotolerans]
MLRLITTAAILFWVILFGLAIIRVSAGHYVAPESYYLVGLPGAMIIMTVLTRNVARDNRRAFGVIAGGSITAGLAMLMFIGILGAGV